VEDLQAGGHWFEPSTAHQERPWKAPKAKAKIKVTLTDEAGNSSTGKATVKLKKWRLISD
jgi:hypothetical protein